MCGSAGVLVGVYADGEMRVPVVDVETVDRHVVFGALSRGMHTRMSEAFRLGTSQS